MSEDNNRDLNYKLGQLDGRMSATEKKVNSLEIAINNIDTKLDDIRDNMNKGRGAWKTITVIASVLVAVGSMFTDVISKIFH